MKNVELNISALNASTSSAGNFVMVLQEINSTRRLPIIIGLQEAQSIAVALEQMQPVRPLTHDLFFKHHPIIKRPFGICKNLQFKRQHFYFGNCY